MSATKKHERGWAIAGKHGLYTGWSLTRREAIAQHVYDLYGGFRFTFTDLSDVQRSRWAECKRRGDRAVKVELRILEDSQ